MEQKSRFYIDPSDITRFDETYEQLQLKILFWIAVAGKTAKFISKALNAFFIKLDTSDGSENPFEIIKYYTVKGLSQRLKEEGIGCYNLKAKGFWTIANSDIDLRICDSHELRKIPGIGRKTAKCFILHSRSNAKEAGLDTHCLKYLKALNFKDVPVSTPSSDKVYSRLEANFLELVNKAQVTPAYLDLLIWNTYSGSFSPDKIKVSKRYLMSIPFAKPGTLPVPMELK